MTAPRTITMTRVPLEPFAEVPISLEARRLGLLDGLRVHDGGVPFRCACCSKLTPVGGTTEVFVPVGVRIGDAPSAVSELCRRRRDRSAWCLSCARRLSPSPILARLLDWLGLPVLAARIRAKNQKRAKDRDAA